MRVCAFLLLVIAAPALADEPARIVVAPAGECAGDERDLVLAPLAKPGQDGAELPAPGALHLSPAQVAAHDPAPAAGTPPVPSAFTGPGACDNPGSGCVLEKLLDDPNPGTGCGFPGSSCP